MKKVVAILVLFATAHAFAAGPEACQDQARRWVLYNVAAVIDLAKNHPEEPWAKAELACENQPLTLISQSVVPSQHLMFGYKFSMQCGEKLNIHTVEYYYHGGDRCEIAGE